MLLSSITTFNAHQCNCYNQTLDAAVHICLWVLSVAVNSWCRVQLSAASRSLPSQHVSDCILPCASIVTASPLHHACPALNEPGTSISNPGHWALLEEITNSVSIQQAGCYTLGVSAELGLQMRSCLYKAAQGFQWVARLLLGIFTFINIELMPANPPYLHPECYVVPGVQRDSAGPWLVYLGIAGNPARPSPL